MTFKGCLQPRLSELGPAPLVRPQCQLLRSHAALDLSRLDAFAAASAELTRIIAESESFDRADLARSAFFALAPYSSQFEKGSNQPGLRDLGQVLSALGTTPGDPAVGTAAIAARQLLNDVVLASAQGALRIGEQMGIHVEQTIGSNLTEDYLFAYRTAASDWIGASRWDEPSDLQAPVFLEAGCPAPALGRRRAGARAALPARR